MALIALLGASCEADGHPDDCSEPATGEVQGTTHDVTINGQPVATHADAMHFDSHAHDYSTTKGCHEKQSHDLTPDQTPNMTINGELVMRVNDSTTDPGSGGTAQITDSGGQSGVTHE